MTLKLLWKKHRTTTGVVLIVLSYLLGWPAVGAFAAMSAYLGDPLIGVIGGSATYVFSWLLLFMGIYAVGSEQYRAIKDGGLKNLWNNLIHKNQKGC